MELGWPLPKRREMLSRLLRAPKGLVHPVYFQNQRQELPIVRVPIELPKYRLDNGRTRSAQEEYLALHPDLSSDFFTADLELEAAHQAQHKILKSMLGSNEKELLKFFRRRDQSEPLILTETGFVLNGNRRLCAMRELIVEDKEKFREKFGSIDVVVLPPADNRELDRLEARLQLTEDIKAEYSWTAKAFMLRTRRDEDGFDEKELSALYEMPIAAIRDLLDMLSLAEAYLEDRGKARQFKLVDKSEFAFRQLKKNREKKFRDEGRKELFEKLSYCLIDEPAQGRVYAAIPDVANYLELILTAVKAEFPSKGATKASNAAALLGVKTVKLDPVREVLSDERNYDAVREIVADVIETEKSKAKETKRGTRALAKLIKANQLLADAVNATSDPKSKRKIVEELAALESNVKKLRKKFDA